MDHILRLQVEHHSSLKLCDPGVARFRRPSTDASQLTFALAAIASLALLLSSFSVAGSRSSALSARLVAVGSTFMSKTALFVLCNVIFLLLAADCRCYFTTTASASDVASSEPGGVQEKQAQHHQVQVEVEQCAVQPCVSCSGSPDHIEQEGEDESTMSANTLPDQEQLSKLEMARLDEEDSITLETVDVEEPTCETAAQGLDRLEINELNKKFDEFIQSRRINWVKEEEAYLLLYQV